MLVQRHVAKPVLAQRYAVKPVLVVLMQGVMSAHNLGSPEAALSVFSGGMLFHFRGREKMMGLSVIAWWTRIDAQPKWIYFGKS